MAQSVLGKTDEKISTKSGSDVKSDKGSDHEKHGEGDGIVGEAPKLQRKLKSRHLQMIAIGTTPTSV